MSIKPSRKRGAVEWFKLARTEGRKENLEVRIANLEMRLASSDFRLQI